MRVCTAGEGSGSDLGAGGSGNEAGGGEMEYDGRVAGIGGSVGKDQMRPAQNPKWCRCVLRVRVLLRAAPQA
jgi:hypothetical protein